MNRTERSRRAWMLALTFALTLTSGACTAVKPWERDILARQDMSWDEDSRLTAIRNHIRFSREGSLPGGGGAGGGCGCN